MSTILTRYLQEHVAKDLAEKMVFIGGPRQVGKTTFAHQLLKKFNRGKDGYFNWDDAGHRSAIKNRDWPSKAELLVFDEVHKFKNWRNLVKGHYDLLKEEHRFLVTGSARLDHFAKGGDSLLGRFYHYRLHPLSAPELKLNSQDDINSLLEFGGFPEPFVKGSQTFVKRWHKQRRERVVYSDIRDLENLREISALEVLIEALPVRVGSPLSRKSIAEDLEVDQKTIESWIKILERVYYCFRISPYGSPKIRAVKKEQKLYLWDWSEIEDEGARFENFIASHLLKFCHYHEDSLGEKMELRYIRDTDKREVDFVVLQNKKPMFAVEAKLGGKDVSPHLLYFKDRTPIPIFYQVNLRGPERRICPGVESISALRLMGELALV